MKICLLGAESTGKTSLSLELAQHLRAHGDSVALVPEVLREWCQAHARTPRPDEQEAIAREQARRADAAAGDWVVADTAPLTVAVYSDMLFADSSLYPFALEHQRGYDLTLLTGLDIAWVADGHVRDGPHVRERVDALLRSALERAGLPYRLVYGSGRDRLAGALAAIGLLARGAQPERAAGRFACESCGDPGCERRLFRQLIR